MASSTTNRSNIKISHQGKKFFFRILIFLGIVASLDFAIGNALRYFYFKQKTGFQYRINYALNKSEADIYILGSSRAMHHYDPQLISQRTGLKCYNAGENGMNFLYSYLIIHGILERNTPEMLILELNIDEFSKSEASYDRLSVMLPYYKNHPEFSEVLSKRSNLENLKLISQIYPFNSGILQIIYGNLPEKGKKSIDYNGYIPLSGEWQKTNDTVQTSEKFEMDSFKLQKFEEIINTVQKNNINLLVTISPVYYVYKEKLKSIALTEKICKKHNVPLFLQYQDSFYLKRPFLFKDPTHLNKKGAELFTNQLIEHIYKDKIAQNR